MIKSIQTSSIFNPYTQAAQGPKREEAPKAKEPAANSTLPTQNFADYNTLGKKIDIKA